MDEKNERKGVLYLVGKGFLEFRGPRSIIDTLMTQREMGITGQGLHLMHDAVLAARKNCFMEPALRELMDKGIQVTVQAEDHAARGSFKLLDGARLVSHGELVDMLFEFGGTCSYL